MKKYVVLLSSGLDSSVNLYHYHKNEGQVLLALTFDYGQRAAASEIRSAAKLAGRLGVPHEVVKLDFFRQWGSSSLIDEKKTIPSGDRVSLDDLKISKESAASVWVPNRNGVFLNIGAGYAESLGAEYLVPGFNAEEAVTFADNSQEFMDQMTRAFAYSTQNKVQVACATAKMNKSEIVKLGVSLNVPFSDLWPCYYGDRVWCQSCESCQRMKRAILSCGLNWDDVARGVIR